MDTKGFSQEKITICGEEIRIVNGEKTINGCYHGELDGWGIEEKRMKGQDVGSVSKVLVPEVVLDEQHRLKQ